jgi:hypothetical protein|tara:strand:+ start:1489 stop:2037 length:549 start_codon:yes stop_codon:yes gene_type:complete
VQTYKDYKPTEFDSAGAFLPERKDWFVLPVGRTRDSTLLDLSNWQAVEEILAEKAKPEEDTDCWEIHRFGHWACGWFEIFIVKPDSPAYRAAEDIARSIEDYPVLNEEDYSEREYTATVENIADALGSFDIENEPEDLAGTLFRWFWDNDQGAVESSDDQGGYPSNQQIENALDALGLTWEE